MDVAVVSLCYQGGVGGRDRHRAAGTLGWFGKRQHQHSGPGRCEGWILFGHCEQRAGMLATTWVISAGKATDWCARDHVANWCYLDECQSFRHWKQWCDGQGLFWTDFYDLPLSSKLDWDDPRDWWWGQIHSGWDWAEECDSPWCCWIRCQAPMPWVLVRRTHGKRATVGDLFRRVPSRERRWSCDLDFRFGLSSSASWPGWTSGVSWDACMVRSRWKKTRFCGHSVSWQEPWNLKVCSWGIHASICVGFEGLLK